MYTPQLLKNIQEDIQAIKTQGKYKLERELSGPTAAEVALGDSHVLMFASNNYLGLANDPRVVAAAKNGLDEQGFGLSSVRFICGTTESHRQLEKRLAKFLGVEDTILYSSCFMANLGFFATIVNEPFGQTEWQDVVYSDELNHASVIDGLKVVKKQNIEKRVYPHANLAELERLLKEDSDKGFRNRIIATDGVFSMEGDLAPLAELVALAKKHKALLFVDDAHGTGALGKTGAGTPEFLGVHGQVDVLSGTFGKALGGALGGYLAGKQELIDLLRQKSRAYLFSNSLPPSIISATLRVLDILEQEPERTRRLHENAEYFRKEISARGFKTVKGPHAIVPIMLGEAAIAQDMSQRLLERGL